MTEKKRLNLLTNIGHLWLNKNIFRALLLSIILIIIQLIIIIVFFTKFPPKVPLFYSKPWGQPQLTSPVNLLLLPGFSSATFILNSFLASLFIENKKFYSYCLSWVSAIFAFFSLVTLVKIVLIIF
jgi:preprotein translocase subunit SecY